MDPSTPRSEEDVDVRDTVSAAAQPGVNPGGETRVPATTGTPRNEDEWTPLLLDFDQDSTRTNLSTARLAHDIIEAMSFSSTDSLRMVSLANPGLLDTSTLAVLRRLVRACSPEALLLSGRMHEEGLHVPSSAAIAAKYYIRASWNESPLALPALGRLLGTARNANLLLQAAWAGDADAQFASAAIRALEIDNRLTPRQAHDMLRRAIQAGSSDALVQLGLWYAGGRIVERDMPKALEAWRMAASMGSEEGRLRLSAAAVFDEEGALPLTTALPVLEASSQDGSLLAAVALARSYELGVGRTANKGIAAHMYRDAAVRGSRSAYAALRRMYEEIRP
jgi:TPR repeat protein